jgi:hypothetical protein
MFFVSFLQNIILSLEVRDSEELILVLCGYHKLLTERDLEVIQDSKTYENPSEKEQQQQELQLGE